MNRIITIGRQFGSGGRELGRRLSDELGFAYYDREIVEEIAKRTELSETYVQNIIEHRPFVAFPIHIGQSFLASADPVQQQNQEIFQTQCSILNEMSEKSDCVIVGRCADYILSEKRPLRIFVYADMDSRIKRCREKQPENEDLTDREMKNRILDMDRQRSSYYEFYTGNKWSDPENYDILVNTSNLEIKAMAKMIAAAIKQ